MTEVIFRFDWRNYGACQDRYRGDGGDYYEGEYAIEPADKVEVVADKTCVGAATIIRLRSRSRLTFRRTWAHIRRDGIDLTVLWFVKYGAIRVSANGAEHRTARAGDFLVTRSARPFFMECLADDAGRHEVVHVTVPTHLVRRFVPDTLPCGHVIAGPVGRLDMASRILEDMHGGGEQLAPETGQRLLEAAFSLIGDVVAENAAPVPEKPTIAQRRIETVLRFIDLHLGNPALSTAMVCSGVGISPRYLTTLLQMHGTSFSTLVWDQRMAKAKAWLSSSAARDVPVSEVAHALGFKSAAHFSRRFKQVYRFNPSTCRAP